MKRSHRLVALTNYFLENPRTHSQLPHFSKQFNASKSSISEDLDIIDDMFRQEGIGYLKRLTGASGGVQYIPYLSEKLCQSFIEQLCHQLEEPERLLPDGYLYMSDLLGDPKITNKIGHMFATAFSHLNIDVVMTIATKGIPLAYAVASFLNVPVVIVRRDPTIIEGSSVSINYVSASSRRVQTMVLTKQSLKEGSKVCIIDDFMKAGGTINGMKSLLKEFNATVKAIGVLAEADNGGGQKVVHDYTSLVKLVNLDRDERHIKIVPGNFILPEANKTI